MFVSRLIKDKRVMLVASGVAAVFASTQRVSQNDALSASHVSYPGVIVGLSVVNDSSLSDDDAKWEYKRKSCNVCKMFLESPCKSSFKTWTNCSDNAKANGLDPNTSCSQLSQDLLSCTNTNDSFFRAQANEAVVLRKQQMEARRSKYRLSMTVPDAGHLQPAML